MLLIKIPTTSYVSATRDMSMISQVMGGYSNYWANSVNPSVNGRTHKAVNYPFFILWPIIYFFRKLVKVVNALGREEYGSEIRIGKTHNFWKTNFCLWGKKTPTNVCPFHSSFTFFLSSRSRELVVRFPSRFLLFSSIFPWLGSPFLCCTVDGGRDSRFRGLQRSFLLL